MPVSEVQVLFRRVPRALPRGILREFAAVLSGAVADGRGFLCLLAGDAQLRRLNRQFLGKDYPTDVLSFPEHGPHGFLGEIAISVDRAAERARAYGHNLEQELKVLMLHGVLHLIGMDHETDRGRMTRAERRWRLALGLPAGLIERDRR